MIRWARVLATLTMLLVSLSVLSAGSCDRRNDGPDIYYTPPLSPFSPSTHFTELPATPGTETSATRH